MLGFVGCGMNLSLRERKTYGCGASSNRLAAESLARDPQVKSRRGLTRQSKFGTKL